MLFVGRGGEGVVLASQLMADTFARAGFWAQSFPEFKAERRGAPISAFLRWDESPIHRRYKIRECDVLAVITPSPPLPQTLHQVRPGGLVVLNRDERFALTGPFDIARVPASRIARDHGILSAEGRPMGNMALLGACVRLLLPDGLGFLEEAIAARMGASTAAKNVVAAQEGYELCTRQRALAGDARLEPVTELAPAKIAVTPLYQSSTLDSIGIQTGSWSLDRPVLTAACNSCALCALFCPEGAIDRDDGTMVIDYLHCKGCGICEIVCPVRDAVHMEEVRA
jgi:2-oxoacid:acceptor oxidoreductase gamma subunit (pyruvate/2-ketoisovalerate family)/2-oxoacid:acceptor oxidoreductase delta subunit (pyruvate/2-ketoisovalerate family)